MMNSLYGRLGMNAVQEQVELVSKERFDEISRLHSVVCYYEADNGMILVRFMEGNNMVIVDAQGLPQAVEDTNSFVKQSVGCSSAITAYARMHMNTILQEYKDHVYYTDTDSIVLDCELPASMIGTGLGQMKLEYSKIKEGIFALPKVYYLELEDGTVIKKAKCVNASSLTKEDYLALIAEKSVTKIKEKWFASLAKSTITPMQIKITLGTSFTKRLRIYDSDGL